MTCGTDTEMRLRRIKNLIFWAILVAFPLAALLQVTILEPLGYTYILPYEVEEEMLSKCYEIPKTGHYKCENY